VQRVGGDRGDRGDRGGSGGSGGSGGKQQVNSLSQNVTLEDLLRHYQEIEVMEGDNCFRCSSCNNELVERAERRTLVKNWPSHFVLSLKRFYYSNGNIHKRLDKVTFSEKVCFSSPDLDTGIEYKLYGVVVHLGSTVSNGHYVAYLTHSTNAEWRVEGSGSNNEWWRCDDERVERVVGERPWEMKESATGTPYMGFYKRVGREAGGEVVVVEEKEKLNAASNSLSVPKEFVESIKLDNVKYMLEQHQEMMKKMYSEES
jgi:hypothetical protein